MTHVHGKCHVSRSSRSGLEFVYLNESVSELHMRLYSSLDSLTLAGGSAPRPPCCAARQEGKMIG
jgi:hypothetical protein